MTKREEQQKYLLGKAAVVADRIIEFSRGKYALPPGWKYERIANMVVIRCGCCNNGDGDPFAVPVDLFIEMDLETITRWIEDCRNAIKAGNE
jgi:hypothetical protein